MKPCASVSMFNRSFQGYTAAFILGGGKACEFIVVEVTLETTWITGRSISHYPLYLVGFPMLILMTNQTFPLPMDSNDVNFESQRMGLQHIPFSWAPAVTSTQTPYFPYPAAPTEVKNPHHFHYVASTHAQNYYTTLP